MTDHLLTLPELHIGQLRVLAEAKRFNVLECGRRFGKTRLGHDIAIRGALDNSSPIGWFAPNYKILLPAQDEIFRILGPIAKTNKVERRALLINGGSIEFWSLDDGDAGRSRKYKIAIIDEASLAANMEEAWQAAIRPTLTDLRGSAWFFLTPKGRNFAHKLYERGQGLEPGWKSWRLPTTDNPHIPADEIEEARRGMPKHVFEQEYLGIPADDGGNPFGLGAIRRCIGPLSSENPVVYGVDLAKSQDWTWIVGLDSIRRVCVSERWQSDWGQTRRRLIEMIKDTPCLIDSTGVGDPIVEDLQRALPYVQGFKFTQTSKQQIMEGLASTIQRSEITVPAGILVAELESFEYEYTSHGCRYTAPQGMTDDGVCALALANHKASEARMGPVLNWGEVGIVGEM